MNDIEKERKQLQDSLDHLKSQRERNELGQFSTPFPLAVDIMRYMRRLLPGNAVSLLEPAIGTGVFYSAYREVFSKVGHRVLGFEVDPHYFVPSQEFWKGCPIELVLGDFLSQNVVERFDMIVANPPYVRHHHIDRDRKAALQEQIISRYSIKMSGLAGLYCYFMILSTRWLKEGGVSCWLVPSEFMDVNYGTAVKQYLTEQVELLHIHRFMPEDLQFADALVSSCIVVFRNCTPSNGHKVNFSIGGSINEPSSIKAISVNQLKPNIKWTGLFESDAPQEQAQTVLGDYFTVKRGLVTGDNDFFILNQQTIDEYHIPKKFIRPILPSPRYISGDRIESENGLPALERLLYLFDCNLPEEIIKEQYPDVWKYIIQGQQKGVQKGYICSRRVPWYSCETREPAAIVVPYMGRSETKNKMFRFILNSSEALATNVYLLLYPKPQYANCFNNSETITAVWQCLNDIPTETLKQCGRFYGGGLRKLEPKELMNTPVEGIDKLMVQNGVPKQLDIFDN